MKKAELISKTKAIIDGIRQTKKPIVDNYFPPLFELAHYFTEQEAKKIREEYLVRISIGAMPTSATKSDANDSFYLGKTLDEWTALTKHKDGKIRVYAARALLEMRPASKSTIQLLTQLLEDEEPPVRQSAALALEAVTSRINSGSEVEIVIPALKRLLSDKDSKVRLAAASSLWWIDSEAEPTVCALTELLPDRDCEVRVGAASVLGMMGLKAKPAIPILVRLLKDENEEVRIAVLHTLAGMGCEAKTAIPTLAELLKDTDENVRWARPGA